MKAKSYSLFEPHLLKLEKEKNIVERENKKKGNVHHDHFQFNCVSLEWSSFQEQ